MTTPLLETRGVWQRFGGLIANSDVSISVGRGEIVGLIGPNGAGKSTLFNLITGNIRVDAGTIRFDGEDVTRQPPMARCLAGVGRTFQIPQPFEKLTVFENLLVGGVANDNPVRGPLCSAGCVYTLRVGVVSRGAVVARVAPYHDGAAAGIGDDLRVELRKCRTADLDSIRRPLRRAGAVHSLHVDVGESIACVGPRDDGTAGIVARHRR